VFHPEGTVTDTFPSVLVTRTLPDDRLEEANGLEVVGRLEVVPLANVAVEEAVDDWVVLDDWLPLQLQADNESRIKIANVIKKAIDITFFLYFIYYHSLNDSKHEYHYRTQNIWIQVNWRIAKICCNIQE
jgi:hypothetical protein